MRSYASDAEPANGDGGARPGTLQRNPWFGASERQFAPAIGVREKVVTLPNTAVRFVPLRPFTPYDPTTLRTGRSALPAIFSFSCCTVTPRAEAWISGRSASATASVSSRSTLNSSGSAVSLGSSVRGTKVPAGR